MSIELVVAVVSIVLSVLALFISTRTWRKDYIIHRYDTAEQALLEIHKIHLEHPEFMDPKWIKEALDHPDPKIRYSYDAFAVIVWNYLEGLYERYGKKFEKSSFYGSMQTLGTRHKEWFFRDENLSCYNPGLITFLRMRKNVEDRPMV